jgi:hypothetical protein
LRSLIQVAARCPTVFALRRLLPLVAVLAIAAAGCGGDDDRPPGAGPRLETVGPIHVHGLGVNPKDGALFIATHTGLFRADEGERRSSRVADRYQDTMGFTVSGPDRFLGSGHPDFNKDPDLPPLLGLIASDDGGESWEAVSLLGEADFHVLEEVGNWVYGFDASGDRLLLSRDAGQTWQERTSPESLVSLAIDPQDRSHIVASGERRLYESRDAGRRWRRVRDASGLLVWPASRKLYLTSADGAVQISSNAGRSWERRGDVDGQPAAFEAEGAEDLYVALHDGTVKRSTDGGGSWKVRSRP